MSVMKRPEEIIMAVIAALWVVLTYLAADYIGAPSQTALLITALTLLVLIPAFLLWQRNRIAWVWPLFAGLLTACWWPMLDWLAVKDVLAAGAVTDILLLQRPWYAGMTFKICLALTPTVLLYILLWRRRQRLKRRQDGSAV